MLNRTEEPNVALLEDEVYDTVPSMVNLYCGATSGVKNTVPKEGSDAFDSQRLPNVPDISVASSRVS